MYLSVWCRFWWWAAHIEAGVAYGMGKKCYAIGEYEATDSLYNIFEEIFSDENIKRGYEQRGSVNKWLNHWFSEFFYDKP